MYTLTAGTTISEASWDYDQPLWDLIPADFAVYIFILQGAGTWSMTIEDCCITGDTMAALGFIVGGGIVRGQATSPAVISLGPVASGGGFGVVITGYTDCPGGFPAGYSWTISY